MSEWTHRICADCYIAKTIDGDHEFVEPARMKPDITPADEPCCFCGVTISSAAQYGGIYIRHDPAELTCTHPLELSDWVLDPLGAWPDVKPADIQASMGYIPSFLTKHDEPAADQIQENYAKHGGWQPRAGWVMNQDGVISYPGDALSLTPAALLQKQDGEIVRFYPGAWVSISQPNGDYEVAKVD